MHGFRIICRLSKWDKDSKINHHIDKILKELEDDNGTSIRQCLEKARFILMYKIELSEVIEDKIKSLDITKYKESMRKLIKKDSDSILGYS